MKLSKIFPIAAVMCSAVVFGQQKKVVDTTFTVSGVCGMCKERIEDAAHKVKGVKMARWEKNTGEIRVVFQSKKCNLLTIQKSILNAGHAVNGQPADSTAYANLPDCCKYRVVEVH